MATSFKSGVATPGILPGKAKAEVKWQTYQYKKSLIFKKFWPIKIHTKPSSQKSELTAITQKLIMIIFHYFYSKFRMHERYL